MSISRFVAIFGLVFLGLATRLLPHPPNFNSINAMALFSAFYLGNRWFSLGFVYLTMFLGDLVLGFHATMPFVYVSIGLIIFIGHHLKNQMSLRMTIPSTLACSLLSFIVYNFGVWMVGSLYPKTLDGLLICYIAAIPFHLNAIAGDLAYGVLFFSYICLVNKYLTNDCKSF